jgi:hypothetical protein
MPHRVNKLSREDIEAAFQRMAEEKARAPGVR